MTIDAYAPLYLLYAYVFKTNYRLHCAMLTVCFISLILLMRVVRLNSFRESILWTFREWRAGFPVPTDLHGWTELASDEDYARRLFEAFHAWQFLGPFFVSQGYIPYMSRPEHNPMDLFPAPSQSDSEDITEPAFPFARRGYTSDEDAHFDFTVCYMAPLITRAALTPTWHT
ncbi:hypothetical protein Hypma_005524 [Hypsizygus marmoreus]|uniref:Uncharacterized protein n=1 Tax=Hypsizygus marmoreus TaxID=39966 RepID=A0A369JZH3_HYPMA|nr:hypothetical protein Hypma_005524 [Hypsizygus marmoreus]